MTSEAQVASPDLVMTSISGPGSALTGGTITVTDTVTASASDDASGAFNVGFYLSSSGTITTANRRLGSRRVSGLAPGASSTGTTAVTLPVNIAPGTYYLGAIADFGNIVAESDETNNALAGNQITVAGPDLAMTAVSGPASGLTGGTITVTNTVTASALAGASRPFNVGIYLSPSSTITTASRRLGSWHVGGLAPGASSTDTTAVTLPVNIAPGTYYLGAIADFGNNVEESDETNNALAGNQITVAGPDLAMTAVSGPASGLTGGTITVTNTVTASVSAGASRPFNVGFYLSSSSTITTANRRLGSRHVDGLAPGASSTDTTALTLPGNIAPGTYYLGAIADFGNNVPESDETNNSLAGNQISVGNDTTPPVGSVLINGGAAATNLSAVTLTASATDSQSGLSQMQFSDDNATWSAAEQYAPTKSWTLVPGDGVKTLYARYQDIAGNWSPACSSTIVLDTMPPVVAITSPVAGVTNTNTPLLSYMVSEGSATVRVDGHVVSQSSGATLEPLTEGQHTVVVESTDMAGNVGFAEVSFTVAVVPIATVLSSTPSSPDGENGWFKTMPSISLTRNAPGTTYYQWGSEKYAVSRSARDWVGGGSPLNIRGDDVGAWHVLPFRFIFYGTSYTQVFLSSNGLLSFSSENVDYYDGLGLSDKVAIAPLWDDLRTDTRPGSDIYVYQPDADSVGFRWQAVTYADEIDTNFEVILYRDGRVRFNYGAQTGGLYGVIGISNGDGGSLHIAYDGNIVRTNNMSSIEYSPVSRHVYSGTFNALNGADVLYYYSVDSAGNAEVAQSQLFQVDTSAPAAPVVQQISLGNYHALAVKADASLLAWGDNEHGQLGDGTIVNKYVPEPIGAGASWQIVSAGGNHSAALSSAGELWVWGYNDYGQLGDGSNIEKREPVTIPSDPGMFWRMVSAGSNYTMAIRSEGTLWAWGLNDSGQLGDGLATNCAVPKQIGTENAWLTVAAGTYHTAALKNDGSLWTWGNNAYGQLGDGTTSNSHVPLQVGQEKTWTAVAAGCYHTVALKSDGTLWAWGLNDTGQLGSGSAMNQASPVQIGMDATWQSIAAGDFHSIALKSDGTLWSWGANFSAQLGDGTTIDRSVPTKIDAATDWISIAAGMTSSAAIKRDGTIATWGGNTFGQLGNGAIVNGQEPAQIGEGSNWRTASGGRGFSLALKMDNTLWAWGDNSSGQLGTGTIESSTAPVQVGTGMEWDKITAGDDHALAIRTDGSLWGWGLNTYGQLGDGSTMNRRTPAPVWPGSRWFEVAAGQNHSLGIRSDGSLWAWGYNGDGQLGNGTTTDSHIPVNISPGDTWIAVVAGNRYSYAIRVDGTIWGWGSDLVIVSSGSSPVPVCQDCRTPITWKEWGYAWKSIASGSQHFLAMRENGDLGAWCPSAGIYHGECSGSEARDWVQFAAGQEFSLGRKQDGTIWSWGNNDYGQLGDGTTIERHYAAQIGTAKDWAFITAGKQHALGIRTDSTLWAWGYNSRGQTGNGSLGMAPRPGVMQVSGAIRVRGGAPVTNNSVVLLDVSVIDHGSITTMQFSNDGAHWSSLVPYDTVASWDLNDAAYGGTLADGRKTVYAKFRDAAGNESNILESSITLDTMPPTIEITSPIDGASYTEFPALIYRIIGGVGEVLPGYGSDYDHVAISSGSVRYAYWYDGWYRVDMRATDEAGNIAFATVKFKYDGITSWTGDPPACTGTEKLAVGPSNFTSGIIVPAYGSGAVNISSPENYSTISGSKVIVKGALDTAVPIKSIVVLVSTGSGTSSYIAQVNGRYFAAKVPVSSDATISVIATDQTGTQHKDSVSVHVNARTDAIDVLASPSIGVATLKQNGKMTLDVGLQANVSWPQPPIYNVFYDWDFANTGYADLVCGSDTLVAVSYQQPGLYEAKVTVSTSGFRYTDSVIVNVLDRDEMDAIFKPMWNDMKAKLGRQDVEGVVSLFAAEARDAWRHHFTRLSPYLPQMATDMGELRLVQATDRLAEYDLRTIRNGEEYSFQVLFMKDRDGAWRIRSF